jgi:hypothetical protein
MWRREFIAGLGAAAGFILGRDRLLLKWPEE